MENQSTAGSDWNATVDWTLPLIRAVGHSSYLPFQFHFTLLGESERLDISPIYHRVLTGGLPRAGRRLSWSPTSAGPCGVANSRISPVLVGADPGWSPSLLGLVMITIWWSWLRSILPEFSRVSKSAKRSSDVCPVIKVSDIAVFNRVEPCWTLRASKMKMWMVPNTYLRLSMLTESKIQWDPLKFLPGAI